VLRLLDLSLCSGGQRSWVAGKRIGVKSMMKGKYLRAAPLAEFVGKRLAWSNGNVGTGNGSACQPPFDQRVCPDGEVSAGANITEEIARSVKRVSRKKDLRDGRIPKGKIARGNQDLGTAAADQFRQSCLLTNETPECGRGAGGFR